MQLCASGRLAGTAPWKAQPDRSKLEIVPTLGQLTAASALLPRSESEFTADSAEPLIVMVVRFEQLETVTYPIASGGNASDVRAGRVCSQN